MIFLHIQKHIFIDQAEQQEQVRKRMNWIEWIEREGNVISIIRREQEPFFRHMTKKIIGSHCKREELENIDNEMVRFMKISNEIGKEIYWSDSRIERSIREWKEIS